MLLPDLQHWYERVAIVPARSPDGKFTKGNAIVAMGSTGSRDAIPVLPNYVISPDISISDRANYACSF